MTIESQRLIAIFKTEYSNLVAVLCQYYGVADVQFAEDIVSDTFLKAMKSWSHNGVPNNPKAWLRKVAQNRLKDHFKRKKIYKEKVLTNLNYSSLNQTSVHLTDEIIEDSQLNMIFVVCNPKLNRKAQIGLALRILCGFNIEEIATALLSNKDNINKMLFRAKKTISADGHLHTDLKTEDYNERLDTVLRIIYLIFNEGYYSSIKEENIREDICWEAMRLAVFLSTKNHFNRNSIYALIALMCFHASRLEARKSGENGDLLFEDQDRRKWNKQLIQKGEKYLKLSTSGKTITKYHLEASIAYWHTTDSAKKWENILQLYNRLLMMEYSPAIAMNRTFALAKANSVEEALQEALKLNLKSNHHYFCLLAELSRITGDIAKEIYYLDQALKYTKKKNEVLLIQRKLTKAHLAI